MRTKHYILCFVLFCALLAFATAAAPANNDESPAKTQENQPKNNDIILPAATDGGFRPDANLIPELYPEKYTGFGGQQAPHNVTLPRNFNWCQEHVCSPNMQQHITYTPLCFLHASLHMLNDRINYEIEKAQLGLPAVYLSRQDYLNHAGLFGFGKNPLEDGGEGCDVMEYAKQYGIPDETCNPWQSDGQNHQEKDTKNRCRNCMPVKNDRVPKCWPVENFVKYRVVDYNYVRGEKAMMNEIYQRGPIQCGVAVDDEFIYKYQGGIYDDNGRAAHLEVDHDVEVVGFGEHKDQKTGEIVKYWVIRNSWGSNLFGTNGFFLLRRGTNVLRLEERCLWAQPDITELKQHLNGEVVGTMFGLVKPGTEPKLVPDGWEEMSHDWITPEEAKAAEKEAEKVDEWFAKNMYNEHNEKIRKEAENDIIVGKKTNWFMVLFNFFTSLTGFIVICACIAIGRAIYLFSQPQRDGYEPL